MTVAILIKMRFVLCFLFHYNAAAQHYRMDSPTDEDSRPCVVDLKAWSQYALDDNKSEESEAEANDVAGEVHTAIADGAGSEDEPPALDLAIVPAVDVNSIGSSMAVVLHKHIDRVRSCKTYESDDEECWGCFTGDDDM